MNERLKSLRATLKLSQEAFGQRLGVTKASISKLEAGVNQITDRMIKSICYEFNVDYLWFTTGEGEMFSDNENDYIALIDRIMADEDEFPKKLFKIFSRFDKEDWLALERVIDKFLELQEKI